MEKNNTPTAVIRRPVDESPQCGLFGRRKYVGFSTAFSTPVWAGADGVVMEVGETYAVLYCELPNITVRLEYIGLYEVHVRPGERVEPNTRIGLSGSEVRLYIARLPDGEPVEPEFFGSYILE